MLNGYFVDAFVVVVPWAVHFGLLFASAKG